MRDDAKREVLMPAFRRNLPFIWAGIAALLFVINAATLRFALPSYIGAANVTAAVQLFAGQVATRDLAWSLAVVVCLVRGDVRVLIALLLLRITIELLDVTTLLLGVAQGAQPLGMLASAGIALAVVAVHGLAIWALRRRVPESRRLM